MAAPVVLWDCDGVILDTNTRKLGVFEATLRALRDSDVPGKLAEVRDHPHRTRFALFSTWYPDRTAECVALFSDQCERMYRAVQPELGALTIAAKYDSVVVSNACGAQLGRVFAHHDIDGGRPFREVRGTPTTKAEHIQQIRAAGNDPIAFVGDGRLDWEVACAHGIPFVYVAFVNSSWPDGARVCSTCSNSTVCQSWAEVAEALGTHAARATTAPHRHARGHYTDALRAKHDKD